MGVSESRSGRLGERVDKCVDERVDERAPRKLFDRSRRGAAA